ncbi:MAG: SAM-dependent methyltransferase [Shewanella sp.]|nr:SAM-dependent methyltransferase [Shewanella sp.]MCF1430463.1 SAM-dependent methyltransferase [Shewanella sp.]MCF1437991.1 SAM-dependent methyltransferase [Shewanella sp.]MCF1456198.1 SAM-dependent methyltransferase [Shewanella sp.]
MLSAKAYSHYSHAQLLSRLARVLLELSSLWRLRTFDCRTLIWQSEFPRLAQRVLALADDQLDSTDTDTEQLLATLLPPLTLDLAAQGWDEAKLSELEMLLAIRLPQGEMQRELALSNVELPHFSTHIKGRKWQQITAFVRSLPAPQGPSDVLEWCAGKGHLGRLISKTAGQRVVSLEWQQALCDTGEQFARHWQLPQRFICADAFNVPGSLFQGINQAVALHACGDLHVTLLKQSAAAGVAVISISPCCYHLIRDTHYQFLSTAGRDTGLKLTRHELQLPLRHSVIASSSARVGRLKELAWRLGFDSLQRQVRREDAYLPLPTLRQSQLSGDFVEFVRWGAQIKGLTLPRELDIASFEETGMQRVDLVRRLDLVAHLLRLPMEHLLLLDRVCFLEEQEYQVVLQAFCPVSVTPRNALIHAAKNSL